MKIVFFGTPEFSATVLEAIFKAGYNVVAVVTAPDKPTGRKRMLMQPQVKITAKKLKLPVLQPEKLRDNQKFVKQLKELAPDLGIVVAYGKIIPKEIINLPKHGILNIHPSLLPKYRGPSPTQTAILNGETETGVTIIKIDEEMDHGDIVAAETYKLSSSIFYEEALSTLFKIGAELLIKIIPSYAFGDIKPQPQEHSKATYTRKFTTEDGEIKPGDTAVQAYNKIRALNPEPGAYIWFEKKGKKMRVKILEAELNNGRLEFRKVQPEGGKPMAIKDFLTGHPNFIHYMI